MECLLRAAPLSVSAPDHQGITPLHHLALGLQRQLLQLAGRAQQGQHAQHAQQAQQAQQEMEHLEQRYVSAAKELLLGGANPWAASRSGESAVDLAAGAGAPQLEGLLRARATVAGLHAAAARGDTEAVERFLQVGRGGYERGVFGPEDLSLWRCRSSGLVPGRLPSRAAFLQGRRMLSGQLRAVRL